MTLGLLCGLALESLYEENGQGLGMTHEVYMLRNASSLVTDDNYEFPPKMIAHTSNISENKRRFWMDIHSGYLHY